MVVMNNKERFFNVIAGKPVDRVAVFPLLMAFAAKRSGFNYRQFASDGKAMAQAQLKVQQMFDLDAITACSDAFRIAIDLGGQAVFPDDTPPYIGRPVVKSQGDLQKLKRPDPSQKGSRMYDRALGVEEMVRAIGDTCAVLGWVDMPYAEACSVCGVSEFMILLYEDPVLAHKILDYLTNVVIDFSLYQIEKGCPMIGAGDAAASLISPEMYREFALPYEQRVCQAVHSKGASLKLHICGNTTSLLVDMISSGADLFNVDHLVDFELACQEFGAADKAFKGNLDPVSDILESSPEDCFQMARDLVLKAKGKKYMLSAGCEIPAEVSDETFLAFCRAAKI